MTIERLGADWRGLLFAACLGLAPSGCSEELGPETMPVADVTGVVTEGGRPVAGGWIEFFPVDGTVGNLRSARIRADGSFDAREVALGLNLIRLINAPIASRDAKELFGAYTSPIRRTISPRPVTPLSIDLVQESLTYARTAPRRVMPELPRPGASP